MVQSVIVIAPGASSFAKKGVNPTRLALVRPCKTGER
jgi:hypothetical protein